MRVTFKRQIKFMGAIRQVGESMNVEVSNQMGVGTVSEQALRALVNSGAGEVEGMAAEAAAGGIIMHLRAKLEAMEERHKKLEARLAKLEGKKEAPAAEPVVPTKKSRRAEREASKE